jgi:hypothetical protein
LSLKAVIDRRLERAYPVPGGGTDDRYELSVSVENDGEQVATDFQLDVEIPTEFLDDSGHRLLGRSINPGFARFTIDHRDEIVRKEHFYPGTRTQPLIMFHYAVKDQTKRQHPEDLKKRVTATVFSGSMKHKKTILTIAELMG